MSELRPWSGFDTLVDGLIALQERARETAARSVDEILTVRNWLIGVWIVAFEQEGEDRARYGAEVIGALAREFKARGVRGLGRSNLKSYRQIALTWPRLGIGQTVSGQSSLPPEVWEALSGNSPDVWRIPRGLATPPALVNVNPGLTWQDDAWMFRLRRELSFSHLLELTRVSDPVARAFYEAETLRNKDAEEVHYATGGLDRQVFVSRYLTRLPTEEQLRGWLAEERELLARGREG